MLIKPVDPDVEPGFLARLAHGGRLHLLAAIDVAAGEHPLAVAGLDRAPDEHDVIALVADDGADRDLRIEVEDEPAAHADQARRFGRP